MEGRGYGGTVGAWNRREERCDKARRAPPSSRRCLCPLRLRLLLRLQLLCCQLSKLARMAGLDLPQLRIHLLRDGDQPSGITTQARPHSRPLGHWAVTPRERCAGPSGSAR